MYFGGLWGNGKYVDTYFKNQLYLNTQLLESKRIKISEATQIAKEFFESHRGDLTIHLAPGWQLSDENTHQTEKAKTQLAYFPLIVFGSGVKSARVQTPVTIDRIAPSIAKAIRIRAPNASKAIPLF